MKATQESKVKRDLRTPKYRMKVETDQKKQEKIQGYDVDWVSLDEFEEINLDEELGLCEHNYISGCPFCK